MHFETVICIGVFQFEITLNGFIVPIQSLLDLMNILIAEALLTTSEEKEVRKYDNGNSE